MKTMQINWTNTKPGQIVEHLVPQLAGASEGESGPAAGISLTLDRSDRTWTLYFGRSAVLDGRGEPIDVEAAMGLRSRATAIVRDQDAPMPSGDLGRVVRVLQREAAAARQAELAAAGAPQITRGKLTAQILSRYQPTPEGPGRSQMADVGNVRAPISWTVSDERLIAAANDRGLVVVED